MVFIGVSCRQPLPSTGRLHVQLPVEDRTAFTAPWRLFRLAIASQDAANACRQMIELVHADGGLAPEDRLHAWQLLLITQEQADDHRAFATPQTVNRCLDG